MEAVATYFATMLFALFMGVCSGFYRIYVVVKKRTLKNRAWGFNLNTGNKNADMYERASVAVAGLFGLNKTETIYFTAYRDDDGRRLNSDDDYRLEGKIFDARWWSITTYDKDHYLISNELDRYSYNGTNLILENDNRFIIHLSKEPKAGNWLPVGSQGNFSITIRLYNPSKKVYDNPAEVEMPSILREGNA